MGVAREGERRGRSSVLLRRLKALHERYGEFAEENGYVRCEDTEVRKKRQPEGPVLVAKKARGRAV